MWKRNPFSRTFGRHDDASTGLEPDIARHAVDWPDAQARQPSAGENPGPGSVTSLRRPLGLFQAPLGRSRPAGGYEPEWCRA
jgi:hypothetical protein